jgi:hypothetical protein
MGLVNALKQSTAAACHILISLIFEFHSLTLVVKIGLLNTIGIRLHAI